MQYERVSSRTSLAVEAEQGLTLERTGTEDPINKPFYRIMFDVSGWLVIPFEGSLDTLLHATMERGLYVKGQDGFERRPEPDQRANWDRFLRGYKSVSFPTARLTVAEFLLTRPSRLKKIYELAARRNATEWFDLSLEAQVKGFVKVEKTRQASTDCEGATSKAPVPRLINPRSVRFNVKLGCYTVAAEHEIYSNIGTMFGKQCITKGLTFDEKAALLRDMWDSMSDPVFVGADASRFDQHTGSHAMHLEHEVLRSHFPGDGSLNRLLQQQHRNVMRGFTKNGNCRVRLGAMRMSGDMNTSLGNCVISSAMVWTRLQELGIAAYAVVDGDDSGVIMERRDVERYLDGAVEWFLAHGYNMVLEKPVDVFEHIEFCQTRPVWVGGRWTMVRHYHKCINNDFSGYQKAGDPIYWAGLMHAIASCGLSLCSGVPVLQAFYAWGLRHGRHMGRARHIEMQLHGWVQMAKGCAKRGQTPISDDTRESFRIAFGIDAEMQVALERKFDAMGYDPVVRQALGSFQEIYSTTAIKLY